LVQHVAHRGESVIGNAGDCVGLRNVRLNLSDLINLALIAKDGIDGAGIIGSLIHAISGTQFLVRLVYAIFGCVEVAEKCRVKGFKSG
jgi:hypothetical protein